MANASNYLEQQIYDHIFRDATFSKPADIAIGLTKDVPSDSSYTELDNAGSYARIPHASGDGSWSAHGTSGPGSNTVEFTFPTATADWGIASGIIITDDAAYGGGNVLLQGALTSPREIKSGDTFKFGVGDIDITIA